MEARNATTAQLRQRLYGARAQGAAAAAVQWESRLPPLSPARLLVEREAKLADSERKSSGALTLRSVPTRERPKLGVSGDAEVGVPPLLRPLIGERVALLSPTSPTELGRLKQQQSDQAANHSAFPFGDDAHVAANAAAVAGAETAHGRQRRASLLSHRSVAERKQPVTREEYEKYLRSPFSFIDKVMSNPYTEEFVYLNPRGAYDLEIVHHDRINPNNYYTMSRAGVTHFFYGDTDFTTLEQWEREFFLFTKMMSIPFFKKFRVWKALYFWKKHLRSQKNKKYTQILQLNLYVLNPNLRASLFTLRQLCWQASRWQLVRLDAAAQTFSLEAFRLAQEEQRKRVAADLEDVLQRVRETVLRACDIDLRDFLVANGFRKRRKDHSGGATAATAAEAEAEDDLEDEYPQKISHAERAAIRTKCRSLTKFIRLADYFVNDTLVTLALDRAFDLCHTVRRAEWEREQKEEKGLEEYGKDGEEAVGGGGGGAAAAAATAATAAAAARGSGKEKDGAAQLTIVLPGQNQQLHQSPLQIPLTRDEESESQLGEQEPALFSIELVMANDEERTLSFAPTLEDFQSAVETALITAVRGLMGNRRLLMDPEFAQYTQMHAEEVEEDEAHDSQLEAVVLQDEGFMELLSRIKDGLGDAFREAMAYAERFNEFRDKFVENSRTNIEALQELDVEGFTKLIEKYEQQVVAFESLPVVGNIGILQVDSARLKEEFLPSPQKCLADTQRLLPAVANRKCLTLLEELQAATARISAIPTTVDEFVQIMSFLTRVREDMENTEQRFQFVVALYKLIDAHRIELSDEHLAAFDKLTQALQTFKMSITFCEASVDANTQRFGKELHEDIPALEKRIARLGDELRADMLADAAADPAAVIAYLEEREAKMAELEEVAKRYQHYQQVLELSVVQFDELQEAREELDAKLTLWTAIKDWSELSRSWIETRFADVQVAEIDRQVRIFNKVYSKVKRALEKSAERAKGAAVSPDAAKSSSSGGDANGAGTDAGGHGRGGRGEDEDEEFSPREGRHDEIADGATAAASDADEAQGGSAQAAADHHDHAEVKDSDDAPKPNPVVALLRGRVGDFQAIIPVVSDLRNPDLQERHWQEIRRLLEHEIKIDDPDFTLGTLLDLHAIKFKGEISVVATKASQEAGLAQMLNKIVNLWKELVIPVNPYKEQKDVFILGNLEDVTVALEDSLVNINTIMGSRFVEPIRDQVVEWNAKLMLFQETLDEWTTCQRAWMYLETIFTSQDIIRQLPEESATFAKVDKGWKEIMQRTHDNPIAIDAGTHLGLREQLQSYNVVLEKVQKRLEQYLETKRMAFPRFYFLSNDELLEILAQSKNIAAVQNHLRKCFDGIAKLELRDKDIVAMISAEGERVPLGRNNRHTQARSAVEVWLTALEADMVNSLKRLLKKGVAAYETTPRRQWVLEHFAQVVMTASQIAWCQGCETALRSDKPKQAMQQWYQQQLAQLSDLTKLVRGALSPVDRQKIVALVTTDVHARDVVANLVAADVDNVSNFAWQQQLRFYWDMESDDCVVRQSNARFHYGYEYMGVTSRLVITPLTDRCWMTITGALHIRFGASPAGPAGTGKTESVKDLAKALGFFCVVFNCSDQIDYKMMGKLFSGLAQCGAWACLDEFNRIDIEVLSVVAQQLLQVRQALLQNVSNFIFQDVEMPIKSNFGCMITMNPGYAGRTELPDNLKVLFRPVAMMIPDYALIAEIMLFAEGFDSASELSRKMVKLYKLSSEQLSQQDHYDFGMRAVKSVLVMAGALKRAHPDLSEDAVLIRAMRDSNVPKFLSDDLPLFQAIVNDLFPGVRAPPVDNSELKNAVVQALEADGLQNVPAFVTKVLQLYDTTQVRFGVMLVGPTGAGKSACLNALAKAMTALREAGSKNASFQRVHTHVLNPKCITMGELYGEVNTLTQEWTDGLGSSIMREAMKDASEERHWVVFDGPVDALWIENMNTVLDDNMTLCLANGERIKLKKELRMLFEVQDLAVASPATVSRCGMVYMTPADLGFMPYVRSWLPRLNSGVSSETREIIRGHAERLLPQAVEFLRGECAELIRTVDMSVAASFCSIFDSLCENALADGVQLAELKAPESKQLLEQIFSFALIWAVGGAMDTNSQQKFARWCTDKLPQCPPGFVFDSALDLKERTWRSWESQVPEFKYDPVVPFFQMLVPTQDTVRYSTLLNVCLGVGRSCFLTGVTGVGKSVVAQSLLQRLQEERGLMALMLSFSAQTSARKTQETIESKLVKLRKNLLGAPAGKKVVVFVDDVNMPMVESYGAQPPIELLRQFQDYRGFYDRQKLFWKSIKDTTLVCSAAPPGGGRNPLSARFTRHFTMLSMPQPSEAVMDKIFSSILGGFLKLEGFGKLGDVRSLCAQVVRSTIELYADISKEMLPTPAKSHYTFNLRDVSKVFQGVLMIKPEHVSSRDTLLRLWIHETMRCFHDRLVNEADRLWFTQKMVTLVRKNLQIAWTHEELFEKKTIMFGDFMRPGVERVYEEVSSADKLVQILHEHLEEFNMNSGSSMDLVFFDDAVQHIARIARVLRQPRGNAMLVGVGGSGKQSLTRLACFMAECQCLSVELKRGFSYADFQEHLKKLMRIAGVEGKQVAFLLTENQVINERFLEDVNNILNSGEVPNLFAPDEMTKIVDDLTPTAREKQLPESRDSVLQFFVQRVRDNLHIVLCISPVGENFRTWCRKFPSLINCTTIDWFSKWPREALESVARKFLKDVALPSEDMRGALVELCVQVHMTQDEACDRFFAELRRKVYTTPKSYLDLIRLYLSMLEERRQELQTNRQRLTGGLRKLRETNEIVAELKATLVKLQPELKKKSEETAVLLKQVAQDQAKAAQVRTVVEAEEQSVKKQAEEVSTLQADAQKDLDQALPALNAAIKSLDSLKKSDISEVKSMAKPPEGVVLVMEAVCIMLDEKADWESAKKVMANAQFLKMLKEYDKDNISVKIVKKLAKYLSNPLFTEEAMKKVSVAATSLCMWVRAMVVYSEVAKEVEPKKLRLAEMNALLADANAKLQEKQKQLDEVNANVAILKAKCDETVAEKARLDKQSQQTKDRLIRAEKLTGGLADEAVRWQADAERIGKEIEFLVGDVFLSAACVSYFGPFTGEYRRELVRKWHSMLKDHHVPVSDNFALRSTLGDEVLIREWGINGLPTDDVSVDSGILVTRGQRWPLMIDPQGQAKKWIKNTYKNKLLVTRFQDPNFLRVLENAVRNGLPLLVEDLGEELDAAADPILLKQTYSQGGRLLVRLGENDVDYDSAFKFFMTTKLPNPHYLPEVCIKVTLLNFTVTRKGLEDQLLGDVVRKEKPEIEEKKQRLVVAMAADRKQLKEIEDKILKMLSESSGMILDDVDLIQTLADSKFTSNIIAERMKEAQLTQEAIMITREKYRPVATRGSILYFVVSDLALIDSMYQYSLTYFQRLFNLCMDQAESSPELERRLSNLTTYLTSSVYSNICRGLFESHKIIFSFLIAAEILRERQDILQEEWSALLHGAERFEVRSANAQPKALSSTAWQLLNRLEEVNVNAADGGDEQQHAWRKKLRGLCADVSQNWHAWARYVECDNPHKGSELPGDWSARLSPFQKLLVLKALREEKLLFGFSEFVAEELGRMFAEGTTTRLEDVYKDTDMKTPIIFVLSTGADPTGMLLRFAKDRKFAERLHIISLGQGQGEHAKRLVESAAKSGDWVLLQNCHLAKSWMPELEKLVEGLSEAQDRVHADFRLWLTSMPCDYFPVSVLQTGIKLTNEPPKGLRANLLRSYSNVVSQDEFENCDKPAAWKKLVFGLCFFHATIQERKKFGPLGWNILYEFNDSDLETSLQVLRMFLNEQPQIPWDALRYVCGQINYGGRVTDDWDRRCLMSILSKFITPKIQEEDYVFSESGIYRAPAEGPYASYLQHIATLPAQADPEVFGMHENANITFQRSETHKILSTVISIQPREVVTSGGMKSDDLVMALATEMEAGLPAPLSRNEAGPQTFQTHGGETLDSLATVLLQEMERFNRLLRIVSTSLAELKRAIRGEVLMSLELDKMYSSMLNNQVPALWERYAYPSRKPLASWMADLHQRIAFMREWLRHGQPKSFWLSGFFFPQGFLTGALQTFARKYQVAIDTLNFRFSVLDAMEPADIAEVPEDGVLIHGLFLDGARWDREARLLEDSRIGELNTAMPIIHFMPTVNHTPDPKDYVCPVYKTSVRAGVLSTTGQSTNFVIAVELPSRRAPDYWVLKGAAMLCQLNT